MAADSTLLELKRQVVLRPEDPEARHALAEHFFGEGQLPEAIRQLQQALSLRPDHSGAARLLARAYGRIDRQEDARRTLEALVRQRPGDPGAREELAEELLKLGRTDDALLHLEEAARLSRSDPGQLLKVAELCRQKRLPERALDALERGLALAPGDPRLRSALGELASELGEEPPDLPEVARALASAVRAREPGLAAAADGVLAGDALAAKRALVASSPEVAASAGHAALRGAIHLLGGQAEKAAPLLAEAARRAPELASLALPAAQAARSGPSSAPALLLARLRARRASSTTVGRIGVLGWTPAQGAVSPLEAMAVPGKGELIFSGNVGPTGKEAGQVAFTCLKARAGELGIEPLLRASDLHLHFTDTEFGKEGASSGLALALAGASAYLKRPLRPRLGATGEITLHGDVRMVAGLHEKLVAAYLHGLACVLLPRGNVRDARQLPPEVLQRMELIYVDTVADGLQAALEPPSRAAGG